MASAPISAAYFSPPVARPPATVTCPPMGLFAADVIGLPVYPPHRSTCSKAARSGSVRSGAADDRDRRVASGLAAVRSLDPDGIAAEPRDVDLESGVPQGLPSVVDGLPHDVRDRDLVLALAALTATIVATEFDAEL